MKKMKRALALCALTATLVGVGAPIAEAAVPGHSYKCYRTWTWRGVETRCWWVPN